MRDGIYKSLAQPRQWKALAKACERPAERGEPAKARAKRAIENDLATELTPTFVRRLLQRADESETLLPSFNAFAPTTSSRELGGENSPLENQMLDHACRLEQHGLRGRDLVQRAGELALKEWMDRRLRDLEQHCIDQAGESTRPMLDAIRGAINSQDYQALISARLAGERLVSEPAKKPISLDEDLAKPR